MSAGALWLVAGPAAAAAAARRHRTRRLLAALHDCRAPAAAAQTVAVTLRKPMGLVLAERRLADGSVEVFVEELVAGANSVLCSSGRSPGPGWQAVWRRACKRLHAIAAVCRMMQVERPLPCAGRQGAAMCPVLQPPALPAAALLTCPRARRRQRCQGRARAGGRRAHPLLRHAAQGGQGGRVRARGLRAAAVRQLGARWVAGRGQERCTLHGGWRGAGARARELPDMLQELPCHDLSDWHAAVAPAPCSDV